jgi:hypothetical protein
VTIDNDAETIAEEIHFGKPALMTELAWAKLYTKTMQKDLGAISSAISKTQTSTAEPEMKKSAEKLHDQLHSAHRTVGELSEQAGVRPKADQ